VIFKLHRSQTLPF